MVMKLQDKVCNKKLCASTEVCIPKGNFNWSQYETHCSDIDYIPYQVMINLYHGFNLTEIPCESLEKSLLSTLLIIHIWSNHIY